MTSYSYKAKLLDADNASVPRPFLLSTITFGENDVGSSQDKLTSVFENTTDRFDVVGPKYQFTVILKDGEGSFCQSSQKASALRGALFQNAKSWLQDKLYPTTVIKPLACA